MNSLKVLDDQFRSMFGIPLEREPQRPIDPPEKRETSLALAVMTANQLVREDKNWKDELVGLLLKNFESNNSLDQVLDYYFKGHVMDAGGVFAIEVEKAIYELAQENINTFGVRGGV